MDMDTDMAMARKKTLAVEISFLLLALPVSAIGAETEITPQAFFTATYSDNVELAPDSGNESAVVSLVGAGISAQIDGKQGQLALDYTARQTDYSHDSERNEFYNELAFSASKVLGRSGLFVDANASIQPVSQGADVNALADYISGDTIEAQNFSGGIGYRSNPAGYLDLSAYASLGMMRYEDEVADNDNLTVNLALKNGRSEKRFFWDYQFSYSDQESSRSNASNISQKHSIKLGMQPLNGFSPFIHIYDEDFDEDLRQSTLRESSRWGPGVRYYWTRRSYLELSYNFDMDDRPDDKDYVGAALLIEPTLRTKIEAEYSQRYFGDAYSFSLSHRNKKLTNSIRYQEEPVGYNRDFYQSGEDLEFFKLEKRLEWQSELQLRRTSYRFSMSWVEGSAIGDVDDEREDIRTQANFALTRQMRRNLSGSIELAYIDYQLETQQLVQRNDEYWWGGANLSYRSKLGLNIELGVRLAERSSNLAETEYKENRAFLTLSKTF